MTSSDIFYSQLMFNDGEFRDMTMWLTLEEAANYLKMGTSTIYKLAREGNIPAHRAGRIGRFDAAELDAWMKNQLSKDTEDERQ